MKVRARRFITLMYIRELREMGINNKHSFSLYLEAVNNVYNSLPEDDYYDDDDDDDYYD